MTRHGEARYSDPDDDMAYAVPTPPSVFPPQVIRIHGAPPIAETTEQEDETTEEGAERLLEGDA